MDMCECTTTITEDNASQSVSVEQSHAAMQARQGLHSVCLTLPYSLRTNTKEEGKLQAVLCWPLYHCGDLHWAGL